MRCAVCGSTKKKPGRPTWSGSGGRAIHHAIRVTRFSSSRTLAPTVEHDGKIRAVDGAIVVEIGVELAFARRRPQVHEDRDLDTVHLAVAADVAEAWIAADAGVAAVRDVVRVGVDEFARENLAVIDDAVGVAVGGPFDESVVA